MTNSFLDHLIVLLGKSNKDKILIDFFVSNNFIKSLPSYQREKILIVRQNMGMTYIIGKEKTF